jgi:hypothetical protein
LFDFAIQVFDREEHYAPPGRQAWLRDLVRSGTVRDVRHFGQNRTGTRTRVSFLPAAIFCEVEISSPQSGQTTRTGPIMFCPLHSWRVRSLPIH